jgi:hypothetical protein
MLAPSDDVVMVASGERLLVHESSLVEQDGVAHPASALPTLHIYQVRQRPGLQQ